MFDKAIRNILKLKDNEEIHSKEAKEWYIEVKKIWKLMGNLKKDQIEWGPHIIKVAMWYW